MNPTLYLYFSNFHIGNPTVVRKFFDRKYFIDKKFKLKYLRGCMTSSKYFYLEHNSLTIIYAR